MNTANSSPMSSSSSSSWCFLLLLLWACTMASGLMEHYPITPGPDLTTYGVNQDNHVSHGDTNFTRTLGCGDKIAICGSYCDLCDELFFSRMECYSKLFQLKCSEPFVQAMESLNNTDWCIWNNVRSPYNSFTLCTEEMAECLLIPWPNPLMQHTFVDIHSMFFRNCPDEALSDPPPGIVFALVMTPICLIPVMVVLVVLKTKNGDGSS